VCKLGTLDDSKPSLEIRCILFDVLLFIYFFFFWTSPLKISDKFQSESRSRLEINVKQ
jgi:hypothetical protein